MAMVYSVMSFKFFNTVESYIGQATFTHATFQIYSGLSFPEYMASHLNSILKWGV